MKASAKKISKQSKSLHKNIHITVPISRAVQLQKAILIQRAYRKHLQKKKRMPLSLQSFKQSRNAFKNTDYATRYSSEFKSFACPSSFVATLEPYLKASHRKATSKIPWESKTTREIKNQKQIKKKEEEKKSKQLENIINATWNRVVQPLTTTHSCNTSAYNSKLRQNVEVIMKAQKEKEINDKEKVKKQTDVKEKIKTQIQQKFKRPLVITKAPQRTIYTESLTANSTPMFCSPIEKKTEEKVEIIDSLNFKNENAFRESRVLKDLHSKLEELKSELLSKSTTEKQRRTRGERKRSKLSTTQNENINPDSVDYSTIAARDLPAQI